MKRIFLVITILLFLAIGVFADDHINTLKILTTDGAYLLVLDHIALIATTNHGKDLWIYCLTVADPIHFTYPDADAAQRQFDQIEALLNQKQKKGSQ
jgi:hypothetical protein